MQIEVDTLTRLLSQTTPSWFIGIAVAVSSTAVAIAIDRRARRHARMRRVVEAIQEVAGQGTLIVGAGGGIVEANSTAIRLLWPEATSSEARVLPDSIHELLASPGAGRKSIRTGPKQVVEVSITEAIAGAAVRGIGVRDVTAAWRGRNHLLKLAHYDSLTGLGNRRLFIDRLKVAIDRAGETDGSLALLYIDVDRFKEVNDSLGHRAGDELLKIVARRFRAVLKQWREGSAGSETFVARLSGDEFAIAVAGSIDAIQVHELARRVLDALALPVPFDGRIIPCSASVGVSLLPDHAHDVEDLVKAADAALYVAKESGRSRYVVYEHSITAEAEYERKLEHGLRQAISKRELRLYYQPKVEIESGTVSGFEALLRWYHEELGFVSPKDFIGIAEESGLICEIGAWCVEEACRQIRAWRDAGFDTVPVSVNVSSSQFADSDLRQVITSALVRHRLEPGTLEIELTESSILDDNETTALTLRDLRAIGVAVALDDFGTGYSALTYLNRFPLDTVKMDRGFLRGIESDEAAAGIAAAVITMSHSLGLAVVAEGVDSARQADLLQQMGCDQIQGFLYSPALPPIEATRFLAAGGAKRPVVRAQAPTTEIDQILSQDFDTELEEILAPRSFKKGIAGSPIHSTDAPLDPSLESRPLPPTSPTTDAARPQSAKLPGDECADDPSSIRDQSAASPSTSSRRSAETRVLVIDDELGSLGPIAMRMMRLGADVHFVQGLDEASLFVDQDAPIVELLVLPVGADLGRVRALKERLVGGALVTTRMLAIGGAVDDDQRTRLREAQVDWLVTGVVEDADLRFFLGAARFHGEPAPHQRAVRVALESTVWIRASGERRVGTMTSLSRRGGYIETLDDYEVGQSIRLEFKTTGSHIRVFAQVAYQNAAIPASGLDRTPGIGVIFYEPDGGATDQIDELIEQIWVRHLP